jgi:hypothetical protein
VSFLAGYQGRIIPEIESQGKFATKPGEAAGATVDPPPSKEPWQEPKLGFIEPKLPNVASSKR